MTSSVVLTLLAGTLVAGVIAILGNVLGRYVGRKKLSVFKLRPRHTSNLFTIASGMLIFLVTIGLATLVSRPVKVALFEYDDLQASMNSLQADLADAREEYEDLVQRSKEVEEIIRLKLPVYTADSVVYMGVVDCEVGKADIDEQLKALLAEGNRGVITLFNQIRERDGKELFREDAKVLGYHPDKAKQEAVERLSQVRGQMLITLKAFWNTYYVDNQVPVVIEAQPFVLVFPKGSVLGQVTFDPHMQRADVVQRMENFLRKDMQAVYRARRILPPPGKDRVVLELPLSTIIEIQDRLVDTRQPVQLRLVANRDIYNTGPVDARLDVVP